MTWKVFYWASVGLLFATIVWAAIEIFIYLKGGGK